MAVLKVKMNNKWIPVAGGSSGSSELYQSLTSNSGDYPVILADSTTLSSSSSSTVNKTSSLKYNPSSQVLTAPTFQGGLTTNNNNIVLSQGTNYNSSLPSTGSVGQLFFLEDNSSGQNDYAEYRICNDIFKAGQVVCENGDDTLSLSSERLQPAANIISDTFGQIIGEDGIANCPIAVCGRVLAYPYEPREEFKAGDAVCAGPNGTVSKMTREEIREYPERILGTVSAIPSYDIWNNEIAVNGRIWIKV